MVSNGSRPTEGISYIDAADILGVDHHYVRMLTSRGVFTIVDRVEVRPNVLKVYISRADVEAYQEAHRARQTVKVRVTEDELRSIRQMGIQVK